MIAAFSRIDAMERAGEFAVGDFAEPLIMAGIQCEERLGFQGRFSDGRFSEVPGFQGGRYLKSGGF